MNQSTTKQHQMLCSFTNENEYIHLLKEIQEYYTLLFNKIFILENIENPEEYLITYNIDITKRVNILPDTISVHRKKEYNTLYTINALNHIIKSKIGYIDPAYSLNWVDYSNCLLYLDKGRFQRIDLKVNKIITIR